MDILELPDEIRSKLLDVISWAANSYIEEAKKLKDGEYLAYSIDELDQENLYLPIRNYFLGGTFRIEDLHLDFLWVGSSPQPSIESKFDTMFEYFLLWAGESLHRDPRKKEEFLKEFLASIGSKIALVDYLPVYGLATRWSGNKRFVKLGEHTQLILAEFIEYQNVKFQAGSLGRSRNFPPGFANTLPSFFLKIQRPTILDKKITKNIAEEIHNFRVLICGLFKTDVESPFTFSGTKSIWHPWVYTNGWYGDSYPYEVGHLELGDVQLTQIETYWNEITQKHLRRYQVTTSRLLMAKKRKDRQEKIIDTAIALEGLFSDDLELTFKYSTLLASITETVPEKKFELYELVKSFYGVRSKIVHGKTLDKNNEWRTFSIDEIDKKLSTINNAIRKCLKCFLLNPSLTESRNQAKLLFNVDLKVKNEL